MRSAAGAGALARIEVDRHLPSRSGRRPRGSSRFAWRRRRRLERQFSGSSDFSSAPNGVTSWSLRSPTWSRCSRSLKFSDLRRRRRVRSHRSACGSFTPNTSRRKSRIPRAPPAEKLTEALAKVGRSGLRVSDERVSLVRHGAAITLDDRRVGHRIRVVGIAHPRPVDDARQHGGGTRAWSESGRDTVAHRPCRSRIRRAHGGYRPRRSSGRDHGGRGLPLRSGGPDIPLIDQRDGVP